MKEPNMHPSSHPDIVFSSQLKDPNSNESFRESMDRKRGYVPTSAKSASIHTLSPSNPSPRSASYSGNHTPDLLHHSLGNTSSNPNSLFTASPLQNHVGIDYLNQGSMAVPIPGVPLPDMSTGTFDAGNNPTNGKYASNSDFNFTAGHDHTHEQPLQNVWGLNTGPIQPPPPVQPPMISQVNDFQFGNPEPDTLGDIGFDWKNWMSTANVSMGAIPMDELEQYGIH